MRSFSPCRVASVVPWLARGALRSGALLLPLCGVTACGTDAERRYADLSATEIALDVGGYRLRWLNPPWKLLTSDPLATGTRTSVMVGGMNREIVPESGAVLQVAKQSTASDPDNLSLPKYRLEAAFVRCSESELADDESCAAALAQLDQATRASQGTYELYGDTPRAGTNDFDQPFYEFMGTSDEDQRYRRIIFYETDSPSLTARLYIEGAPNLGEYEITRLVNAFELTAPEAAVASEENP